ncbi:MAG: metal-sulfur cluster assembly factor, partial [Bacteroidota bacterium]
MTIQVSQIDQTGDLMEVADGTNTSGSISEEQVLQALRGVKDPDLHKDIVTLNMIRDMAICGGIVKFRFVLTTPACPVRDQLKFEAEKAVMGIAGVERVEVQMDA